MSRSSSPVASAATLRGLATAVAVALGGVALAPVGAVHAAPSTVCENRPSGIARAAAAARAFPIDAELGYGTVEVAPGVHAVSDGNFSMMIVAAEEGTVLIDAPATLGPMLEDIVASLTDVPVTHVVYSHGHADHIGGAAMLAGDIEVLASRGATEELERVNVPGRTLAFGSFVGGSGAVPAPTTVVERTRTLRLGDVTVRLDVLETGHSRGDMIAWIPEAKALVAVDFTWPAAVPWIRLGDAVNVPGLIAQNRTLLEYDFEHLVAGHFAILGDRSDVETTIEYLEELRAASIEALRTVSVADVAASVGATDPYGLMDVYFQAVIDAAAEPVIERWHDRLQGAGTWTCDHAQKMVASLRFDEAVED